MYIKTFQENENHEILLQLTVLIHLFIDVLSTHVLDSGSKGEGVQSPESDSKNHCFTCVYYYYYLYRYFFLLKHKNRLAIHQQVSLFFCFVSFVLYIFREGRQTNSRFDLHKLGQ